MNEEVNPTAYPLAIADIVSLWPEIIEIRLALLEDDELVEEFERLEERFGTNWRYWGEYMKELDRRYLLGDG